MNGARDISLADDRWCFACGEKNDRGRKLAFTLDDDGALHTSFTFGREHQGYAGIVHGGLIGLILDEVMVNCAWRLGRPAVTAELEIRYRKAVRVGETVHFTGRIHPGKGRLLAASSEARNDAGALAAEARAKCMIVEERR